MEVKVGLAAALPAEDAAGFALPATDAAGLALAAAEAAGLTAALAATLAEAALEAAAGLLAEVTDAGEALEGALVVAAEPPHAESAKVPNRTRSEYDLMLPPCFLPLAS